MIDREEIKFLINILTIDNKNVNLDKLHTVVGYLEKENIPKFLDFMLTGIENSNFFKTVFMDILHHKNKEDMSKLMSSVFDLLGTESYNKHFLKKNIVPLLNALKNEDDIRIFETILDLSRSEVGPKSQLRKILHILKSYRDRDILNFYTIAIEVLYPSLNLDLLNDVLKTIKEKPSFKDDIFDSFSNNQLAAKTRIINELDDLKILNSNTNAVIWGCWYGSIIMPLLSKKLKHVLGLDIDEDVIDIGKKKLLKKYSNIDYQKLNIFEKYLNSYQDTNLIINTSCEHMPPMKEWKWFGNGAMKDDKGKKDFETTKLNDNCYFVFQSNNMYGIEGHINCVDNIADFRSQLPDRAKIIKEIEIEDTRGIRFMIIGKMIPLSV